MKHESDTRQRLLEMAMRLVWEQSYGAVSVDDICERAGANKGSFYHFFPSKSDLAVAAMEEHWHQLQPQLDRAFAAHASPLERLSRYCDSVYQRQKTKRQEVGRVCGCAFTCLGLELSTQDEKVRQKSQQVMERYCQYLEAVLRDAISDGLIEKQDAKAQARALYGAVLGVLVQAKIENDLEIIRSLKPTFFRLIGAREPALV